MANFFKDYQTEIKNKNKVKKMQDKQIGYTQGQVVYINPAYDIERNGKKYFADYLSKGYMLLADTKKDALNGVGCIYHYSVIIGK